MEEFYQALLNNKFDDDDAAATHFFNADRNHSSYQKLKTKTRNTLLNHVFFLNESRAGFSDRQRAYFKCYRYWAAARILMGLYGRAIGAEIAEEVLRRARAYDFSDIVMDVAKNLRMFYGTQAGNQKRFDEYNQLCKLYWDINPYEDLAEEYYTELSMSLVKEKGADRKRHEIAKAYYAELVG